MNRHSAIFVTLQDLKIAKVNKKVRKTPCSNEVEQYMSAMSYFEENSDKVPSYIQRALSDCMAASVSSHFFNLLLIQ